MYEFHVSCFISYLYRLQFLFHLFVEPLANKTKILVYIWHCSKLVSHLINFFIFMYFIKFCTIILFHGSFASSPSCRFFIIRFLQKYISNNYVYFLTQYKRHESFCLTNIEIKKNIRLRLYLVIKNDLSLKHLIYYQV